MSVQNKTKRIQVSSQELLTLVRSKMIEKHPELNDEEFEIEFLKDIEGICANVEAIID
jgi:hypothetical protein